MSSLSVGLVAPATSNKPSLSASIAPSKIPSLSVSTSLASAPLSTRSLMPSLSLSKSKWLLMPSPSVSIPPKIVVLPLTSSWSTNEIECPEAPLKSPTTVKIRVSTESTSTRARVSGELFTKFGVNCDVTVIKPVSSIID